MKVRGHASSTVGACTLFVECTDWPAACRDVAYRLALRVADICHFVHPQLGAGETRHGQPASIEGTCPATGTYFLILEAHGTDAGGEWTLSYEILCPVPERVCCVGHACYLVSEEACATLQGDWHPEWESCGPPDPCDVCTPVERSSWGGIKVRYR